MFTYEFFAIFLVAPLVVFLLLCWATDLWLWYKRREHAKETGFTDDIMKETDVELAKKKVEELRENLKEKYSEFTDEELEMYKNVVQGAILKRDEEARRNAKNSDQKSELKKPSGLGDIQGGMAVHALREYPTNPLEPSDTRTIEITSIEDFTHKEVQKGLSAFWKKKAEDDAFYAKTLKESQKGPRKASKKVKKLFAVKEIVKKSKKKSTKKSKKRK